MVKYIAVGNGVIDFETVIENGAKALYLWSCDSGCLPAEWSVIPDDYKEKLREQAAGVFHAWFEPVENH